MRKDWIDPSPKPTTRMFPCAAMPSRPPPCEPKVGTSLTNERLQPAPIWKTAIGLPCPNARGRYAAYKNLRSGLGNSEIPNGFASSFAEPRKLPTSSPVDVLMAATSGELASLMKRHESPAERTKACC